MAKARRPSAAKKRTSPKAKSSKPARKAAAKKAPKKKVKVAAKPVQKVVELKKIREQFGAVLSVLSTRRSADPERDHEARLGACAALPDDDGPRRDLTRGPGNLRAGHGVPASLGSTWRSRGHRSGSGEPATSFSIGTKTAWSPTTTRPGDASPPPPTLQAPRVLPGMAAPRSDCGERSACPSAPLQRLLERLVTRGLLERSDRPADARVRAMHDPGQLESRGGVLPHRNQGRPVLVGRRGRQAIAAAGRSRGHAAADQALSRRATGSPSTSGQRASSPTFSWPGGRGAASRERRMSPCRNWRTLLALSVGVQQWVDAKPRRLPLKTSPSGGARHPIECYALVRKVPGLPAGIYHYDAARHQLERLRGRVSHDRIASYYPSSGYFAAANVHIFLTAVLSRQLWRYPYARAYRAALAEAGHVCQTFCLDGNLAWLGALLPDGACRTAGSRKTWGWTELRNPSFMRLG